MIGGRVVDDVWFSLIDRRTQSVVEKVGGIVISDRTVGSAVDPSVRSLVGVVAEVLEGLL